MEEEIEITDKMMSAYFIGFTDSSNLRYKNYDLKYYFDGLKSFFEKLTEEYLEDNNVNIWLMILGFKNSEPINDWIKKFHIFYDMTNYFTYYIEKPDEKINLSEKEIICFFLGMLRWFPDNTENFMKKQETFLKCVSKELCPNLEFEEILDYWYFFSTERIVDELEEICTDRIGCRYSFVSYDNEKNYDSSEEGLMYHKFQEEMK